MYYAQSVRGLKRGNFKALGGFESREIVHLEIRNSSTPVFRIAKAPFRKLILTFYVRGASKPSREM